MKWKPIEGYEDQYSICDLGYVYSLKSGRLLKARETTHGYLQVALNTGHKSKFVHIHKLVAEAFVPNPQNLPQVNHIDGVKINNSADNLEWCNNSQNQQHAYDTGLKSRKLSAGDRTFICTHYTPRHPQFSTHALSRQFGVSQTTIRQVLKKGGVI